MCNVPIVPKQRAFSVFSFKLFKKKIHNGTSVFRVSILILMKIFCCWKIKKKLFYKMSYTWFFLKCNQTSYFKILKSCHQIFYSFHIDFCHLKHNIHCSQFTNLLNLPNSPIYFNNTHYKHIKHLFKIIILLTFKVYFLLF